MQSHKVTISLPTELFESVEELRGDVSRSVFVRRVLEKHVKNV